jgi:hypothetical protein
LSKASGSELYFDVLRSMSPSSRLQDAIKEAEKVSETKKRQREAAEKRAARAHRQAKGSSRKTRKTASA